MGHLAGTDREYRLLQQRLDRNLTGAPDSPAFAKILRILFSPEDAEIARQMPTQFISTEKLARKLDIPVEKVDDKMTEMARRGLVIDIERKGRRYVSAAPVVIGFFEFTFMRTRDDMPMEELSELFEEYFFKDERFVKGVFAGQTQIGRSLVREEALPEGDHVEILDWERASHIVGTARTVGVSLCACRHHASHLGTECERSQRTCMTFNGGAESMIKSGIAERVTTAEGMQILEDCKEAGLAQTADNVQQGGTYMCNCCGCCCGMMNAITRFEITGAVVTSNWVADFDLSKCRGCPRCAKACPVGAIEMVRDERSGKRRQWPVHDADLCLGCGVCYPACKFDVISMKSRDKRVYTPESMFDRVAAMAIERGKLGDLLLDNTEGLGPQAVARVLSVLERTPPYKAAMAIGPLRSTFLKAAVRGAGSSAGPAADWLS